MPKVIGTHGKSVNFKLLGVAETLRNLQVQKIAIEGAVGVGILQAATFVEEEIKESIAGHRAEPKSVDTGEFLNSVHISKVTSKDAVIESNKPQAIFMEFGTSRGIEGRHHFKNTEDRTKSKVRTKIKDNINNII